MLATRSECSYWRVKGCGHDLDCLTTGSGDAREPSLGKLLKGQKGGQVTACAQKCMPSCIRGGSGVPLLEHSPRMYT